MNTRFFLATTAAVAIATSAFAQSSPSTSSSSSPATQQNSTATPTPSASSTPSPSTGSAQTTSPSSTSPSTSAQTHPSSSTGQTTNSGTTNTTQAPASSGSPSQAQSNPPSSSTSPSSNQAQTNSPSNNEQTATPSAPANNQAQSPTGNNTTNTAQQPSGQQNAADRSSNTNVNASVTINDQQRTRISASISHLNVQPLTSVNFSLSVGTVVPRDVRLQPLPAEVVEIVPQYRGYNFVLVKDEIVIIEPSSYKIVTVMPYSGRSTAAAPARSEQRKTTFSDSDRDVVRKHAKARPVERERRTTGSTVRTEIRSGERVPDSIEIEAFPEEVYRDAPALREYRYINRDSRTYIVEPRERRIIEEID